MAPSATVTRRVLQPLWSALDAHLAPRLSRGALLCVSGGSDSRALLEATAGWQGRAGGELVVACVDHRVRAAGGAEARAVAALAGARGFPAVVVTLPATSPSEGALREARYQALAALARQRRLGSLVVAHHEDDVAEGAVLAWLGAGGGPGGAAPPRVTDLDGVDVVRPFLHLPRATLRGALSALGALDWIEDPEARSARARVRRVLGALGRGRDLRGPLARAARRRREDEDALASAARSLVRGGPGALEVDAGAAPAALARRALEQAVRARGDGEPRRAAAGIATALSLVAGGRAGRVDLAGARLEVDQGGVVRVLGAGAVAGGAAPTQNVPQAPVTPLAGPASMRTVDGKRFSDEADGRRPSDEQP